MSTAETRPAPPAEAPVFAALGDATRLALVSRLSDGRARSIAQLTGGLGLSRQGISKHLRVLERVGIVSSRRVGRESRYTYVPAPIDRARTYLQTVSTQWDDALARLRTLVESDDL